MRKPFVLAWAISPEQVVQFVKGQTTGWSVQSKKHHVKFNHITWTAALQQLICGTGQPKFQREGWCGTREGLSHSCLLHFFTLLYNWLFFVHFLSSVFPCPPLIRGCSNAVSLSWGLFTHLGTAFFQPLLKPLISVSFLLCGKIFFFFFLSPFFFGMIFIKGVIRSQVGTYVMNYLLTDSIRNRQMRTTHPYWPKHFCHY